MIVVQSGDFLKNFKKQILQKRYFLMVILKRKKAEKMETMNWVVHILLRVVHVLLFFSGIQSKGFYSSCQTSL
jgi:uncharacterized membrane protein